MINPTIGMEMGTSYTFVQSDISNWMHPMVSLFGTHTIRRIIRILTHTLRSFHLPLELPPPQQGFAYFPDGAHDDKDELEPGITQTASNCIEDFSCPTPRYFRGDEFLGVDGTDDFGLGKSNRVISILASR